MAVTYAWRLDSDKFAYIVPPENLSGDAISEEDGYLSSQPLSGTLLKKVADTAQQRFGTDGGKEGYLTAFANMEEKIRKACSNEGYRQAGELIKWDSDLENADMLSADMYYNVDAQNCADLRGVGIKGTMYLGSLLNPEDGGIEPTNVSYYASGASVNNVTILPGLPGYTDIYGIYLTDQIENENDVVSAATSAPEYMFVVRNGKDGADGTVNGEGGELIEILRNEFRDLKEKLQKEINNLKVEVSNLTERVITLENYIVESYPDAEWKTKVDDDIKTISDKVDSIEDKIDSFQPDTGGGSGESTGGGSISVTSISGITEGGYYILVSEQNDGQLSEVYALDYAVANREGIVIGSSDAQVQISSGGTLQSTDKIYAKNGFYQMEIDIPDLPALESE